MPLIESLPKMNKADSQPKRILWELCYMTFEVIKDIEVSTLFSLGPFILGEACSLETVLLRGQHGKDLRLPATINTNAIM